LTAFLLAGAPHDGAAVDRIVLEIGEVSLPGGQASGAAVAVDLRASPTPVALARVSRLRLEKPSGTYTALQLICTDLVVKEPEFACRRAGLSGHGGPIGSMTGAGSAGYNTEHKIFSFGASDLPLAGGRLRLEGSVSSAGWSLSTDARAIDLVKARALAAPWIRLPDAYSFNGRIDARGGAVLRPSSLTVDFAVRAADLSFSNQDGTVVAQNVVGSANGTLVRKGDDLTIDAELDGSGGQTLAGPVLLDFMASPLTLRTQVSFDGGQTLEIGALEVSQKNLIEAHGTGQVTLGGHPGLTRAHVDVRNMTLPAAYGSFAQLSLATTALGALTTAGRASGAVDVADGGVTRLDAHLDDISVEDPKGKFSMMNVTGDIHWAADPKAPVGPSHLAWSHASAYGLSGARADVSFTTRERSFALVGDTRLPVLDGAIVVHTLAVRRLGTDAAELDLDAEIEPISMPLLSKAFSWPSLSGRLAGRIPGVAYRDRVLTVEGDIVANVFNGTMVGSRFRVQDPLGSWPRLFADVTARGLDLDLVTHTFAIGSITGLLNADVKGLELFNWSPVAFDARLYSTPGDRSKHLISQKAVASISNIGGGAGGVAAALQSGLLRFFDRFHYDLIGISCQLRDEVCLMAGIEPARTGYYLVRGSGVPRIDIIGNAGRVDWPQLVAQIQASIRSQNVTIGTGPRN